MHKLVKIFLASLFLLTSTYSVVNAIEIPNFPSCLSPSGTLRVYYPDGTHGIVGSTSTYVGSDKVYTISDDTITQCYCSTDGVGIQTNWWKSSSLTEDQIEILKKQGWHYVPDGSLWGLDESPYLAINSSYSCLSKTTTTTTTTSSSSDSSSQGSSSSSSNSESSGQVLGLAATGDQPILLLLTIASLSFIIIGIKKSHAEKNNS